MDLVYWLWPPYFSLQIFLSCCPPADVLAGRKTTGTITGEVLYAGKPVTTTFLRRFTGYVEQFGKLCPLGTSDHTMILLCICPEELTV